MKVEWRRAEVELKLEYEWQVDVKVDVIIIIIKRTIICVMEAAKWFVWLGGRE